MCAAQEGGDAGAVGHRVDFDCAKPSGDQAADDAGDDPAEDEENDADLVAEDFDRSDQIGGLLIGSQNERDVSDVHEVEADNQKMIH